MLTIFFKMNFSELKEVLQEEVNTKLLPWCNLEVWIKGCNLRGKSTYKFNTLFFVKTIPQWTIYLSDCSHLNQACTHTPSTSHPKCIHKSSKNMHSTNVTAGMIRITFNSIFYTISRPNIVIWFKVSAACYSTTKCCAQWVAHLWENSMHS